MRLLFITQKVDKNDDVLGVYHRWIEKLAAKTEKINVICLYKGKVEMPGNVVVHSLGKELTGHNRFRYLGNFFRLVWKLRSEYDVVFVHMNPEYVILAGWLWRMLGKRVVLWYAHYLSNLKLRIAAIFPNIIVTSTRRAFPYASKKLIVLQQGIDTGNFSSLPRPVSSEGGSASGGKDAAVVKFLFLGRIAPVKKLEVLVRAIQLASQRINARLSVVGSPTAGKPVEAEYLREVQKLVSGLGLSGRIGFEKPVANILTPEIYRKHDIFVNLTVTGSFDKSTLEAMACGSPILVSNLAFRDVLPEDLQSLLMFQEGDHRDLAEQMVKLAALSAQDREAIGGRLRDIIVEKHGLDGLVDKLYSALSANDN
ncbi:MAG: glycosyltransferase family 4 protein [bacterium]|nr:glycosyltransferase family 4 protein [bacterium]